MQHICFIRESQEISRIKKKSNRSQSGVLTDIAALVFWENGDGESVNPEKRRVSVSVFFLVLLEVLFKKSSANLIW